MRAVRQAAPAGHLSRASELKAVSLCHLPLACTFSGMESGTMGTGGPPPAGVTITTSGMSSGSSSMLPLGRGEGIARPSRCCCGASLSVDGRGVS